MLKRTTLTVALAISLSTCFSQSKKELQEFIVSDLKKYAGTWLYTWDGKIDQKETNYNFSIQDCDLTITSRFSDDGITWGDAKVVIPITDISEVTLIEKEVRGTITMSTRLFIKTGKHSIKRYWNGKLIDMGDSDIIGLDSWTSDLGSKYKSTFEMFSKFCN